MQYHIHPSPNYNNINHKSRVTPRGYLRTPITLVVLITIMMMMIIININNDDNNSNSYI